MDTKVTQTNTTSAFAVLSHADIERVLGLAVMVDAGLKPGMPGTTIDVELAPADEAGRFTATVSAVIDHNYLPDVLAPRLPASPAVGDTAAEPPATAITPSAPPTSTAAAGDASPVAPAPLMPIALALPPAPATAG